MSRALGDMLPLAVAIAVSPVPIVAVVLMLMSAGGRGNAVALVAGWAVTLAAVAGLVAALELGGGEDGGGRGVAVGQLVVAAVLVAVAAFEWRGRPRGAAPRTPRWMVLLEDFGRWRALALGVGLVVLNAKDGSLTVAAGAKLAEAALSTPAAIACVAVFVLVASATLLMPVAVEVGMGARADAVLTRWHRALERHGSTATIVVTLAVATALAAQGLSGL
ncbi:MAG TPA: GAP family protein [Baekduia sp.]|nr:GAP family protein [Baekduia sp.]